MTNKLKFLIRLLSWTPVDVLFKDPISSLSLFSKFKRHETYFQLKAVLVGIIGFTALFALTSLGSGHISDLPWSGKAHYYSVVLSCICVLLLTIALLEQRLRRLVIFRRPWVIAAVSYVLLIPLMVHLNFVEGTLNGRLFIVSSSFVLFIATVYWQQSFALSVFVWLSMLVTRMIYLIRNYNVAEVRLL